MHACGRVHDTPYAMIRAALIQAYSRGVASCAAVGASPVAGLTDDGWAESLAGDVGKAEFSKYSSQTGDDELCRVHIDAAAPPRHA